jgi:AcrR family transcriptional regulator
MALKGHRTNAGDRTRIGILDATLRLLGRAGPDAFSASTLAKEAGVSKATLFHHFGSLDEIPLAALEQFWFQSLTLDTKKPTSAREYLVDLGRQVITLSHKHSAFLRAHIVFLTKAIFDSRLRQRLVAGSLQMHRVMVQQFSARLPKSLSASEIDAMTRMVEMTLDGLMIGVVVYKGSKGLAETRRAWVRFVNLLIERAGAK